MSDVTSITHRTPMIGQRVLVYDPVYHDWTIAYWTRESKFEEWASGASRDIAGFFWLALPPKPGESETQKEDEKC